MPLIPLLRFYHLLWEFTEESQQIPPPHIHMKNKQNQKHKKGELAYKIIPHIFEPPGFEIRK